MSAGAGKKSSSGSSVSNSSKSSSRKRTVTIEKCAYIKAALHASKHFDQHTGGYLIGSIAGDGDSVNVSDVLPLVHSHPSGPIFQIGAELVTDGNKIVGYYFCNEEAKQASTIPEYIEAVAASQTENPLVVLRLDLNLLLSKSSTCFHAVDVYNKDIETTLHTVSGDTVEGLSDLVSKCLAQNDQEKLFDVDELLTSSVNIGHLKTSNLELTKKLTNLSK